MRHLAKWCDRSARAEIILEEYRQLQRFHPQNPSGRSFWLAVEGKGRYSAGIPQPPQSRQNALEEETNRQATHRYL